MALEVSSKTPRKESTTDTSLENNMNRQNREEITFTSVRDIPYVPDLPSPMPNLDDSFSSTSHKRCRESLAAIIENHFKTPPSKHIEIKFITSHKEQTNQKSCHDQLFLLHQSPFLFETPKNYSKDAFTTPNTLSHKGLSRRSLNSDKGIKARKHKAYDSPNSSTQALKVQCDKENIKPVEHQNASKPHHCRVSPNNIQSIMRPRNTLVEKLSLPSLQYSSNTLSDSDFFTPPQLRGSYSYSHSATVSPDKAAVSFSRAAITDSLRRNIHDLLMPTLSETEA